MTRNAKGVPASRIAGGSRAFRSASWDLSLAPRPARRQLPWPGSLARGPDQVLAAGLSVNAACLLILYVFFFRGKGLMELRNSHLEK